MFPPERIVCLTEETVETLEAEHIAAVNGNEVEKEREWRAATTECS